MSRRVPLPVVAAIAAVFASLLLVTGIPRVEAAPPRQSFAGPWIVQFRAVLTPDARDIRTEQGTTFSEYFLSFSDRVLCQVPPDGKVSFENRQSRFHHQAQWKTAAGETGDYRFGGTGLFKGSGQFADASLKLHLEWTSGKGSGKSAGQKITKPVGTHEMKSDWMLKPVPPAAQPGAGGKKLAFSGQRITSMPQQLAGCPPQQLVETVYMVQAPVADLEVAIAGPKDPLAADGTCTLSVTVRNLGPDESQQTMLRVVLPNDGELVSASEGGAAPADIVVFPVGILAAGATSKAEVVYRLSGKPRDETTWVWALAHISSAAVDPHPENNGAFQPTTFKAREKSAQKN
jgi:hypothetical protein